MDFNPTQLDCPIHQSILVPGDKNKCFKKKKGFYGNVLKWICQEKGECTTDTVHYGVKA